MHARLRVLIALSALLTLAACEKEKPNGYIAPEYFEQAKARAGHHYAMKEGDEYGYEPVVSGEAAMRGESVASLVMYSYLGRKGNTLELMIHSENIRVVAECTLPCEFVKLHSFVGDRYIKREIVRLNPSSVMFGAFDDAANGRLEQMLGEQRGQKITFWVDGEKRQLQVAAADKSDVKQ